MIKSLIQKFIIALLICISNTLVAKAAIIDELNPEQMKTLVSGQQVSIIEKINHMPWPRIKAYQLVPGTPEESAAVTMDWELKTAYTRGLKKAKISKVVDPITVEVDYTATVPILGDENFTMQNKVSIYDGGQAYRINFTLAHADHMKASEGSTRFEAFNGATLMATDTFTDPNRPLAGLAAGHAVKLILDSCNGFAETGGKRKNFESTIVTKPNFCSTAGFRNSTLKCFLQIYST